jgi:hypothetical protein
VLQVKGKRLIGSVFGRNSTFFLANCGGFVPKLRRTFHSLSNKSMRSKKVPPRSGCKLRPAETFFSSCPSESLGVPERPQRPASRPSCLLTRSSLATAGGVIGWVNQLNQTAKSSRVFGSPGVVQIQNLPPLRASKRLSNPRTGGPGQQRFRDEMRCSATSCIRAQENWDAHAFRRPWLTERRRNWRSGNSASIIDCNRPTAVIGPQCSDFSIAAIRDSHALYRRLSLAASSCA